MLGLQSDTRPNDSATLPNINNGRAVTQDFLRGDSEFGSEKVAEYFQAAILLVENHEYRSALRILREVLVQAPNSGLTFKAISLCAEKLGNLNESSIVLEQLLRIDNCAQNYYLLGNSYLKMGQDQLALRNFLKAQEILMDDSELAFQLHKSIGNIYVKCHDFESAEESYNKAFCIRPNSPQLLVNYATLEIQRGNWNAAILRFREAVSVDPQNDAAWIGLALVHRQFGDFDLSWANLEQAIEIHPYNRTALQLAISWVVKDQKWYRVSQWLENFLAKNDDDAAMSMALAQIWYVTGHLSRSRLELTRALALDPMMDEAAQLLALVANEEVRRTHGGDLDRENRST